MDIDTKIYKFHYDAGHGWLEVDKQELIDLGIADKISQCSYKNGNKVYLEEDCDMSVFWQAYIEKYAQKPQLVEVNDGDDSPIRNYKGY